MGLDGHDRAVSLAAASEENDMPGRFQIGPHCGWLSAEFSHAYTDVLYSKPCKKEILAKIALHYPEAEREAVWE